MDWNHYKVGDVTKLLAVFSEWPMPRKRTGACTKILEKYQKQRTVSRMVMPIT